MHKFSIRLASIALSLGTKAARLQWRSQGSGEGGYSPSPIDRY